MSCIEVLEVLVKHGCADLTNLLYDSTSFPVANGGLGDVFSGRLRDGIPVAIKTIRTHHDPHRSARVYHKQAAKEIYTWSKCKHPNVVELVGLAVFRDCIAMVSWWQENGTLPQYLSKNPSANRCKLSTSICAGLVYLHDNDIVHGDLKGANVLVSKDGTAMLADFGNATMLYTSLQFAQSSTSITSTPRWTAPEILEGLTRHTEAGDVYSLGMTILETFTSKVPFPDKVDLALIFHVVLQKSIPTRPNKIIPPKSIDGDRLWSILTKCWTYNPKNRPIARGIWEGIKSITPDTLMVIGGKAEGKLKDNSKE
ncbi:tyrosine kinase catalytic domain protein [Rhizoctonia solani 123E]|uniref:Tyrosine kinase catalytic domain protein n=1 Tax=Rhizoctonia solani 123E TaxID=1423351 RepID=A0A074RXZ0_9AGAM|nr:tyrosine kinase catalytic domain protein [Rhizoctonia solani 123E]